MTSPTLLWVIGTSGRVFTLSTVGRRWKEVESPTELEFKRVSALSTTAWAVGCDHQLYVLVHARSFTAILRPAAAPPPGLHQEWMTSWKTTPRSGLARHPTVSSLGQSHGGCGQNFLMMDGYLREQRWRIMTSQLYKN